MKLFLCFTPFQTVLKSIISLTKFNAHVIYVFWLFLKKQQRSLSYFSALYIPLINSIVPHSIASKQVEQDITD